jgi:hypothetical protein
MRRRDFTKASLSALGALTFGRAGSFSNVRGPDSTSLLGANAPPPLVNGERLNAHLAALSEFGKNSFGGVSRVAYSDFDRQGREYVVRLMREAKLTVTVDAAGNIWASPGSNRQPIIWLARRLGSRGNFDGTVGSLSAISGADVRREDLTRHRSTGYLPERGRGTVGSRAHR